jgi:hypothetical protein
MLDKLAIPHIVFTVERADLQRTRGSVTLGASVPDRDLWDAVIAKLNGLTVAAAEDLTSEITSMLRAELGAARVQHAKELEEMRARAERAEHRLSLYVGGFQPGVLNYRHDSEQQTP